MQFVDHARIKIRSGNGGHGCVSFRREKFIPKGGPDGGDGGKGGDVYIVATSKMHTLYDFRVKRKFSGENGRPGEGSQRTGRGGNDLYIELPVGTLVYLVPPAPPAPEESGGDVEEEQAVEDIPVERGEDISAELPEEYAPQTFEEIEGEELEEEIPQEEVLIADLVEDGQEVLLAKGGRGGKGNLHFKSSTMRTPRFAQPGERGEEKVIRLELKVIADAGFLGLPNAGKSTLLSAISAARPKIAAYPFTTLAPNLGVLEDYMGRRMIAADIPGLIEGAHSGQGLGHQFLKHVERTRFLVHILSAEELNVESPWEGFDLLNDELAMFDPKLADKTQILVVNKIDLLSEEDLAILRTHAERDGMNVHFISALHKKGVDALVAAMWEMM